MTAYPASKRNTPANLRNWSPKLTELSKRVDTIEKALALIATATWVDWKPTIYASGAMTIASQVDYQHRYKIIGNMGYFETSASYTTGGVASTEIYIPLPIKAVLTETNVRFGFNSRDGGGTALTGAGWRFFAANIIALTKAAGANWTLGANAKHFIQGFFEVATD